MVHNFILIPLAFLDFKLISYFNYKTISDTLSHHYPAPPPPFLSGQVGQVPASVDRITRLEMKWKVSNNPRSSQAFFSPWFGMVRTVQTRTLLLLHATVASGHLASGSLLGRIVIRMPETHADNVTDG